MRKLLHSNQRGFTLIEFMIVLVVFGILLTVARPLLGRAVISAKEAALREDLFVMRDAVDKYYADKSKYPSSLKELVEEKYIRNIPKDPFTDSRETWVLVYAEGQEGEQGIYDVKSGADGIGIDGTAYKEW